jgi:predicted aldo/keto reductase-like oxidoreductase
MPARQTRRRFLQQMFGLGAAALPWPQAAGARESAIPRRRLGRTNEMVSMLGLGGWHMGSINDDRQAIGLVREAVDLGVTFMDNAWGYHQGRSEELMGRALTGGRRQKVFLMTKHHGRDKKTSMRHLEDSLRRLGTDVIDLWQFHEVIYRDDPDRILGPNGGIEAAELAKQQGKVRFIGFTGHKDPAVFLRMLSNDYPWDAVQMPVNVLDAHFRSFQQRILPLLIKRDIGAIAMKSLASGHLLRTGTVTPAEALTYTWSQPVTTLVSGMPSSRILHTNARLAAHFRPLSREEQGRLLARTEKIARSGEYEPFKTTRGYDSREGRLQHDLVE